MSWQNESVEALEAVLRLLDIKGNDEPLERAAIKRYALEHGPEKVKTILEVAEAMSLYLDPDYQGRISPAAKQILANGPLLTARARAFFQRAVKILKEGQ